MDRLGICIRLLAFSSVALAACDTDVPSGREAGAELVAFQRQLDELLVGVEDAEATRAVKRLQHAYGHYSEFGLWHDFADLFAENAVGHYSAGPITGKHRILEHFIAGAGQGRVGLADGRLYPHINLSPVITLGADGKTAKGRWRIIAMLGSYGGNASWAGGVYENEYVKENDVWMISKAQFHSQYGGRYENGWRPTVSAALTGPSVPFHFTPERAAAPMSDRVGSTTSGISTSPVSFSSLAARFRDLEQRVQRLAAEIEVTNLQHAYGYYVDRKLWDDAADLFVGDGMMELGQRGVYVGKDRIRRALDQFFGPAGLRRGELNDRIQLQTIVSVAPDARTATVRSTELSMTGVNGEGAEWGEGAFENEFVRDDGVWKIKSLRFYPRLITDYDEGWAKSAKALPGPNEDYPPDRPPTQVYESYPTFSIPPFHFLHPVTGRPTQYPAGTAAGPVGANATGTPTSAAAAQASIAAPQTPTALAARLGDTVSTFATVRAYDAAENLANAYSYYLDEHMWGEVAEIFTRDGWNEVPHVGVFVGRERIRRSLETQAVDTGWRSEIFEVRNLTQPVIHVDSDGQSATVRTRLLQINARSDDGDSYVAGILHGRILEENGAWRIGAMDLDYTWAATYTHGWARVGNDQSTASRRSDTVLAPDRPLRGPVLPPFPEIEVLPFHYGNPASAREPAVLWR